MPQPRVPGLQIRGPWHGLANEYPPEDIPPNYAQTCLNVSLSDGVIRPRYGTVPVRLWKDPLGDRPVSIFQWDTNPEVGESFVILIVTASGQLLAERGEGNSPVELAPARTFSGKLCTFIPANRNVYIIDGGEYVWRTNGKPEGTRIACLPAPVPVPMVGQQVQKQPAAVYLEGTYTYAFSLYHEGSDTESNASFHHLEFTFTKEDPKKVVIIFPSTENLNLVSGMSFSHWRVYRRDIGANEQAHWLIGQVPEGVLQWDDPHRSEDYEQGRDRIGRPIPSLGNRLIGPFAPTRNGCTPKAITAATYKDRFFYADAEDGSIVRFSAIGHPAQVHEDDYVLVGGDSNDHIAGMTEYAGQLVILKRNSIWILSGAVLTQTNEGAALGSDVLQSLHQIYQARTTMGGANIEGNGLIVAGQPERIYYNARDGLRRFDGIDSVSLTGAIRDEWKRFASADLYGTEFPQRMTFADDARDKVLLVCNGGSISNTRQPSIMAYHYGMEQPGVPGGWVPWQLDGAEDRKLATCVADCLGLLFVGNAIEYRPALVGRWDGYVLYFSEVDAGDHAWPGEGPAKFDWHWASGKIGMGVDGMRKQVFLATWKVLFAEADVRLGFSMDNVDPLSLPLKLTSLRRNEGFVKQPVLRAGTFIVFVVKGAATDGVSREIGVRGVSFDVALLGHQ